MKIQVADNYDLDTEKIDAVKQQIRTKWKMWLSFIFLGWSYGSLGKRGIQAIWYALAVIIVYGLYEYFETKEFTIYASLSVVGFGVWIIWVLVRIFTLNRSIDLYNRSVASFYGLTDQEKQMLGIE